MSGVSKFSGEGQEKNHHVVPYYWPISEEKVAPSEKVTPSDNVEKGDNLLYDMYNTKFTEKLDLPVRNDSVTPNGKKKQARDDLDYEETTKDSESSSGKKE